MVSVIVPTYNRANLLPRSIVSIQKQTFTNWEAIVVDDRSTDSTAQVFEDLARQDGRLRMECNCRTRGPSGARNHGVQCARGKYIAFLDSDDEWMPFHLEQAVHYLDHCPEHIDVFTANPLRKRAIDGEVIKRDLLNLDLIRHTQFKDLYILEPDNLFQVALEGHRILTTQTIVARREVFETLCWDERIFGMEDCLFPIEVAFHRFRIGHRQDFHVTYWVHDQSLTNGDGKHNAQQMIPVLEACVKVKQAVLEKFPLTKALRKKVELELADALVWLLGYNGYAAIGNHSKARDCYWGAIKISPSNLRYWKVLLVSYAKQALTRKRT